MGDKLDPLAMLEDLAKRGYLPQVTFGGDVWRVSILDLRPDWGRTATGLVNTAAEAIERAYELAKQMEQSDDE